MKTLTKLLIIASLAFYLIIMFMLSNHGMQITWWVIFVSVLILAFVIGLILVSVWFMRSDWYNSWKTEIREDIYEYIYPFIQRKMDDKQDEWIYEADIDADEILRIIGKHI